MHTSHSKRYAGVAGFPSIENPHLNRTHKPATVSRKPTVLDSAIYTFERLPVQGAQEQMKSRVTRPQGLGEAERLPQPGVVVGVHPFGDARVVLFAAQQGEDRGLEHRQEGMAQTLGTARLGHLRQGLGQRRNGPPRRRRQHFRTVCGRAIPSRPGWERGRRVAALRPEAGEAGVGVQIPVTVVAMVLLGRQSASYPPRESSATTSQMILPTSAPAVSTPLPRFH